ncbi:DUF664 domain-containing protein [Blastococcus sp. BMG 814]|uniref:DUF664 domain-containing protein n=1 Tax=Blastococcus carthaginiensis TaxID=3050034 RepID=A0ABT9IAH1_9ACTN|nr:DUF664 domain-containing protein [Blastococcus carthaginiensis]MDP5182232.1 DUF664 domain-containing protein [Blastococcus carthaginiensis]
MSLPERVRPPGTGDERAQLAGWLDLQRALVHYKFGDDASADWRVPGLPLAQLLAEYARQCAVSAEIVAAASLDDRGCNKEYGATTLSLRWILGHMVEEVARHVGHLDLLREMLDGRTGYY